MLGLDGFHSFPRGKNHYIKDALPLESIHSLFVLTVMSELSMAEMESTVSHLQYGFVIL